MNSHKLLKYFSIVAVVFAVFISGCVSNAKEATYRSGKKSSAKTNLRIGIVSVLAYQTGEGKTDFSNLNISALQEMEQDLVFIDGLLSKDQVVNNVGIVSISKEQLVLQSRSENGECFYVEMNTEKRSRYGSAKVDNDSSCPDSPGAGGGEEFTEAMKIGWEI